MSVIFDDATFGAGQASTGAYLLGTYTATGLLAGVTPVTINGTIDNPGSVVSVNINAAGITAVGAQGTYLGYSQIPNTTDFAYYFSVTGAGIVTPVEIAVTGATLPAVNVATPINTTNVTAPVGPGTPCFVTGTLILTTSGEVAVEDLKAGDVVLTASGSKVPVEWIGHHTVRCDRCFDPTSAWPVRISAHAFGHMRPHRDLLVSPGHAICVPFMHDDGILIPAYALVNEGTVAQERVDTVTYWHVELETHDILLANGLTAESYIDVGNRSFFEGADSHVSPDHAAKTLADYCRPYHSNGPVVEAVRLALRDKAFGLGWNLDEVREQHMRLVADGVIVEPTIDGLKARFILPAEAKDVWLVSETSVPNHVHHSADARKLGVQLETISIGDGLTTHRDIALNDPLLWLGFHQAENDTSRWTSGRARLPAELWEGCRNIAILQIGFAAPVIPKWTAPVDLIVDSRIDLSADVPSLKCAAA